MLECVVNLSEGRDAATLEALAATTGGALLDLHADAHHHRSVFTLAGPAVEEAARALVAAAVARLDLSLHAGAHPRFGVADVVPFVPLGDGGLAEAVAARDRFASWAGSDLALPCFLYGPERSLPEVRREAFGARSPDTGPARPHPTAGAVAVGARPVLVAYNLWLAPGIGVERARQVARSVRGPSVRALGLEVGGRAQVSCNLVEPGAVGPAAVYDLVVGQVEVERAELVGLVPADVLAGVPPTRWAEVGLSPESTIEARLGRAGLDRSGSAGRGRR